MTAIQSVDDAPRFHIDIETDDLDAETDRLLKLGAVEISRWLDCRTLKAPGGHLLCVIPVHSDPEEFRAWPRSGASPGANAEQRSAAAPGSPARVDQGGVPVVLGDEAVDDGRGDSWE